MSVDFNQGGVTSRRKLTPRVNFLKWIGVVALILFLPILWGRRFCFRTFYIPTAAMQPTLMGERHTPDGQVINGDHIVVELLPYRFHRPHRGDVAVFKTDTIPLIERDKFRIPENEIYVKRIVGLPGERVSIEPHSILINGQKLVEPKIFETLMAQTNEIPDFLAAHKGMKTEVQLGPDEYYVIGDNIVNSLDSRYYGAIKKGHFVGKAFWIYWPTERWGIVE